MITLIDHALHDSGIGSVLDGTLSVLQFSHSIARLASTSISWPTAFQVVPEFQKELPPVRRALEPLGVVFETRDISGKAYRRIADQTVRLGQ